MLNLNKKYIITSGNAYVDIDALACCLAYKNLLKMIGFSAHVLLTGPLNETISKTIMSWNLPISKNIPNNIDDYYFILLDISDLKYVEPFVIEDNVVKVFDHHHGFEKYWINKIGHENCHIEKIGACATLIWEQYKKFNQEKNISAISANLLFTSIISNTLDLKAYITTDRDIQSLHELRKYITLPKNWKEHYYSEIENKILTNIQTAIMKDKKILKIKNRNYIIGQIELWNAKKVINKKNIIETVMKGLDVKTNKDKRWLMNIPSISQGFNYIIVRDQELKSRFKNLLNISFIDEDIGKTSRLWLRKEIIQELSYYNKKN